MSPEFTKVVYKINQAIERAKYKALYVTKEVLEPIMSGGLQDKPKKGNQDKLLDDCVHDISLKSLHLQSKSPSHGSKLAKRQRKKWGKGNLMILPTPKTTSLSNLQHAFPYK